MTCRSETIVGEPLGLMAALEDGRAEVHVVDVQRVAVDVDVGALQAPRFARLPRQIVLDVVRDREAAEDRVAELMAAQTAGRRHHPAHAERGADLLDVAAAVRAGADHFLQRDRRRRRPARARRRRDPGRVRRSMPTSDGCCR